MPYKNIDIFRDKDLLFSALLQSVTKLSPFQQVKNPIMFTVYVGSILTTLIFLDAQFVATNESKGFILAITLGLWLTLMIANFAESIAQARGKSQARMVHGARRELLAKKLAFAKRDAPITLLEANQLRVNDLILVEAGDYIPSDGVVVHGIAFVNESAVTGESAPVVRESGGDKDSITGGTLIISDWLIIRITSNPGQTFIDHMIYLVEGAKRNKTSSELSLSILLTSLTMVFLIVCATLLPFSIYSVNSTHAGQTVSITVLVALFVCLAPTTIGGLLSAISIAGMDRMLRANLVATSSHVVETAGDVDTLILDKTGTITLGNRHATEFITVPGATIEQLADAALLSSLADETPEGRSIVVLAKDKYHAHAPKVEGLGATFIPFTAHTRMSGANLPSRQIRKGAASAIKEYVLHNNSTYPAEAQTIVDKISRKGGTALVVVENGKTLGVIHLKDIIKGGLRERFARLRAMGIKTIMVSGDNPLTTAAIAAEAGVDDFLADALPEDKLTLIRDLQAQGHIVAMTGDGTNDSPALAQADVAVAMNSGTQAAKEAGNLIDLDSNPTKVIEVVEIGKQLLMTRGALTTFSLANDVSKNFAIIPAAFVTTYPVLQSLDIMHLSTPEHAILSAVIFNALVLVGMIPVALRGVMYKSENPSNILRRNILIYGLGGLLVPFIGIKTIDMVIVLMERLFA